MGDRTFTIIKPNAVAAGNTGKIVDAFIEGGFRICAMRMLRMDRAQAEDFYAIHKDKPFFADLVEFMTSGPVVVMVLEKPDAVAALRRLVGNTDPALAGEGSIRRRFGEDKTRNSVHASDSDENAVIEYSAFFKPEDII